MRFDRGCEGYKSLLTQIDSVSPNRYNRWHHKVITQSKVKEINSTIKEFIFKLQLEFQVFYDGRL